MRNAEIEAAILAAPDDPNAYLVYADWLQSHGDPRGELITLQHAMRARNDIEEFARFRKHEEVLRNQHAVGWLGEVVAGSLHRTYFEWRMGFVDAARLDAPRTNLVPLGDGDASNPYAITRGSEPSLAELVRALVDSTCGCFVRTITLRGTLDEVARALLVLPSVNLRRINVAVRNAVEINTPKRALAGEIMRMLNANVDLELTIAAGIGEVFEWVRPTPSKRRT